MKILDYDFTYVCEIKPITHNGEIVEYFNVFEKYSKHKELKLNAYGRGPFCKFSISAENSEGVYIIGKDKDVVYVGETLNFRDRFNLGYGNISPRNCFVGGQSTNCRINNLIFNSIKQGSKLHLYFLNTNNRIDIELDIIKTLSPKWNLKMNNNVNDTVKRLDRKETPMNKYAPLENYLMKKSGDNLKMTYKEIESILGDKLPASAYKYPAWWANGEKAHKHSLSWVNAGWKIDKIVFGEYVIFTKQ
jgi:hypothetical protein